MESPCGGKQSGAMLPGKQGAWQVQVRLAGGFESWAGKQPASPEHRAMTEQEWLTCTDPHPMFEHLRGKACDRKLRLFAVACSRRISDRIDAFGRHAVDVAERFADGFATPDELRAARLACQSAGGQAAWYAAASNPAIAARNAACSAQAGVANNALIGSELAELHAQAALLRDIFGPMPLRPSSFDPSWLTPAVVELTRAIYEDKTFDRILLLADALEEAGCGSEEILRHLRGPGPHVRGCWVVDGVLGKE
jgi:hypothetical protein